MAKKYRSKPHDILAFRLTDKKRAFPDWFIRAVEEGKASHTKNNKGHYITIYGDKDQVEKAYLGDYVCKSEHGKIYALPCDVFEADYTGME